MRTYADCFPCFIRQTIIALRQLTDDEALQERIIKEVLPVIAAADMRKPPAYTTTFLHRMIREQLGQDPFKKTKHTFNSLALGLYPELRERVRGSAEPLWTAARLAIAGNVIDFGIFSSIDINGSVTRALEPRIAVDDYESFRAAAGEADSILYLLDNSGEIVFDRLLIEELQASGRKVKAVVKGSAVLNDATMEDAMQIGLPELCEVTDNGSDAIGTILEWTSPGFRAEFEKADLIVSKGQGNFETLSGTRKKTFFLFQSKCGVVSKDLGLEPGSMLLKKS
ncbi:MAG: ARMT1-like domain-containing protein [Nitrospiraceae bacterium]|nr:ARMT1-like domain-containing protein [Nitrospiraceae bacterium]